MDTDSDLGDLSQVKLSDVTVSFPIFIDKSTFSPSLIHYVLEVSFPPPSPSTSAPGTSSYNFRSVERVFMDFVRLSKYLTKVVPQCRVVMGKSVVPKRKKGNAVMVGMAIDQRRMILQTYLRSLLLDEAVAKLGTLIYIVFM